jgi:predicted secreted protein
MATYTGQNGVFKLENAAGNANVAVAEVTSFTVDHTVNTIESTSMTDSYREYKTGMNEWSGSADVLFEDTLITTFGNVIVGSSAGDAAVELYPAGETGGYPKLTGNVIVTGFSVASEMEGMVTATISFQGNGALSMTANS